MVSLDLQAPPLASVNQTLYKPSGPCSFPSTGWHFERQWTSPTGVQLANLVVTFPVCTSLDIVIPLGRMCP